MKSIWRDDELPKFPQLDGNVKTDVLIIGGGLAGILTAYFLHQNGVKYILAEKGRICGENTGNTTAKITAQHGLIYHRLVKMGGQETARRYLDVNLEALERYARLCRDIDCGFERKDNAVYTKDPEKLEREMAALEAIGYPAALRAQLPVPVEAAGAVSFPNQAQFDPLRFVSGIAGELHIFENTFVRAMDGLTAITDRGRIEARQVVCATHFPFVNRHGGFFVKLYQERSYVLALENAGDVDGMFVDDSEGGFSFRNAGELLLLGGGGGRTGKHNGGWTALRDFAGVHYPEARERAFWAAQDCMSLDGMPYIGQYGRHTPGFYVETGFNKWGMTGSMVAATLISDRILGRKNEAEDLFDPARRILRPQLAKNGLESVAGWLTPSRRVCPHLGCALKWNKAEHSWDCPCHGSRFTKDGRILNNPSLFNSHFFNSHQRARR